MIMMKKISAARMNMFVSMKQTHEIMEFIKGKNVDKASSSLKRVMNKEEFVPFLRYPSKGHKRGIPAGYPKKASAEVISLLGELRANAKVIGGDPDKVIIVSYNLGRGGYPRFGSGSIYRHGKRTNLKIIGEVEVQEAQKPEKLKATGQDDNIKTEGKQVDSGKKEDIKSTDTNQSFEVKDASKENN